jgi:hypothetical protein
VTNSRGKSLEVNIFGSATRQGTPVMIIGEAKSQLSTNDVDAFLRKKVKRLNSVFEDMFLVLITHMTSDPGVEDYVKQHQIALYYSYEF